jgi:hypothetical protein
LVAFFYSDLNKNFTGFFISLSIVNFEPVKYPIDVISLFTQDHPLLIFGLNKKLEPDLLDSIRLQGDRQALNATLIGDFLIAPMIQTLFHHLFIYLNFGERS